MSSILYFVGAGLTKSLEVPGKRIPLMMDFVSVMADNLDSDIVLTTLVELEREGVFEWTSDELRNLADRLQGRGAEDSRTQENREKFRTLVKRRPSENIENLMKRLVEAKSDVIRFNFAVNAIFSDIGWSVDWRPLEKFLSKQFRIGEHKHTFISFNYDLVLDRCVERQGCGRWSGAAGYGFEITEYVDRSEADAHMNQFNGLDGAFKPYQRNKLVNSEGQGNIEILKPHGSLNWLVLFEGNYRFVDNDTPVLCLAEGRHLSYYPPYDLLHSSSEGSPRVESHRGLFLLPPSPKLSTAKVIQGSIQKEGLALLDADEVFVLGWSMPNTDRDQECLIRSCVQKRQKPFERVTVVNLGQSPEYFQRVADVFGMEMSKVRIYNNGFQDFVASPW